MQERKKRSLTHLRALQRYTYTEIKRWYRLLALFGGDARQISARLNVPIAMVKYHIPRFPARRRAHLKIQAALRQSPKTFPAGHAKQPSYPLRCMLPWYVRHLRHARHFLKLKRRKTKFDMTLDELGDYLAGLIDGDGTLNKKAVEIAFDLKDYALAKDIQRLFGLNSKSLYDKRRSPSDPKQAYGLFFNGQTMVPLLRLIHGRLVGESKVVQMQKASAKSAPGLDVKPALKSVRLKSFWSSGFMDADGSGGLIFSSHWNQTYQKHYDQISLQLNISQNKTSEVMDLIAPCFGQRSTEIKRKNGRLTYEVTISKLESVLFFMMHFVFNFPCQGRKWATFQLGLEAGLCMRQGMHLLPQGKRILRRYRNMMNRLVLINQFQGLYWYDTYSFLLRRLHYRWGLFCAWPYSIYALKPNENRKQRARIPWFIVRTQRRRTFTFQPYAPERKPPKSPAIRLRSGFKTQAAGMCVDGPI